MTAGSRAAAVRRDRRRLAGLIAGTASLAVAATGCTAPGSPDAHPAGTTSSTPTAGGTPPAWATSHPPASCAVTLGSPHTLPPAVLATDSLPVPYLANWYGTDTLWTRLPPTGVVPAQPGDPGGLPWDTKYPWWRLVPGVLSIQAQHLGGPPAAFAAHVPSGYAATGFQSSSLQFAALGCWRVTATNAGRSLTFTVWVQSLGSS